MWMSVSRLVYFVWVCMRLVSARMSAISTAKYSGVKLVEPPVITALRKSRAQSVKGALAPGDAGTLKDLIESAILDAHDKLRKSLTAARAEMQAATAQMEA